jgi:RimJ/RimL family protein N-acetyltransferase
MIAPRTPRLRLEPVTVDNADVLWRIMQSAHLREYQDVPRYTREEFRQRVASRPKRFDARAIGRFEWLVIAADSGRAIGWISLRFGDQARGISEIGYSLLVAYRGRGYASEAVAALIDASFRSIALKQIDACCVPGNVGSRRLLGRLGFVQLKIQRHGAVVRGRPVDIVLYRLRREEWEAHASDHGGSANSIEIPASAKPK